MIAVWLVFWLAWGALHWFIVPRISEFRPQLEARASAILGVPVRIDAITAQSNGMIPSFELAGVRLFDAQGRESLHLPRVLAALSPRSLWNLGFEQLYIDRPELNIRRAVDGRIYVAGLDFSADHSADSGAADWLFSQAEFVIHEGTVQWTDERRGLPTLALQQVNLVLRNRLRQHSARLDATPPPQWGERFSLRAMLRQPLLSTHSGQWRLWDGQLYALFDHVDLSELRRYADLDVQLAQGRGALRAWADVQRGQIQGATADVALESVDVTLAVGLQPMALQSVSGRLGVRLLARGFEFFTEALQFQTGDGLRWPGGNVRVQHQSAEGSVAAKGELSADRLDLAALSQIANRLPFDPKFRGHLQTLAPKGLVEHLKVNWQGTAQAITEYQAKGRVVQFELASRRAAPVPPKGAANAAAVTPPVGIPGIAGLSADFDFNEAGGQASVVVQDGALDLPGVFEDPVVRVAQLASDVKWQVTDERIAVQVPNLKFSNSDAQGEAQIKWETADPRRSGARARFPGVLDLQASLSRADGTKVHRYLPLVIPDSARHYVRDAIVSAVASGARFKVKGDLHDMPFKDPKQGEFRISANIQDATFAYVPRSLQSPESLPWPALTNMSGELVVERARLQVNQARAQLGGRSALQVSKAQGLIATLDQNPTVVVDVDAQGPLGDMLGFVNASPVASMIGQALDQAAGAGKADLRLKLNLPLAAIEKSTVLGSVTLHDNDVQISANSPRLSKARGVVHFSETGFSLSAAQVRMLGGESRLEGGTVSAAAGGAASGAAAPPPILLRAQGGVTAEGLRQAKELGFLSRLAQHASGSTSYSATLAFRRGVPELKVLSNLQGLALSLPAPMSKAAQTVLPIKFENALLRESLLASPADPAPLRDQLTLEVGRIAAVTYVREHALAAPRVLRGAIGVGLTPDESVNLPDEGVVANINLGGVNLDAWSSVLSQAAGTDLTPAAPAPNGSPGSSEALGYLPTVMAIRAGELTLGQRKLHNVVVGGSREGLLWRANLDAVELNGYVEYRQPSDTGAGRVFARLARLKIAPSTALEVESLLDEQPATIPALDIVVSDFELRGKRLGRVEIDAVNRGAGLSPREAGAREWRLNKFNIVMPEASLSASGNWTTVNTQPAGGTGVPMPRGNAERRRTLLNFKLDIADSGELLTRLGMKDVIRRGKGKMEGQVVWVGSPITVDYASMSGAFGINVENGQFLKQEPGLAKLLGVLSLQSLPRRLALDFRDVFSEGFAFDFFRGDVVIEQGIANTNNLQMKGVNAAVLMDGSADIAKETQDIRVVVVPEVNAGTASLIATAINPAIGLGTFLAQIFLRKPLIEAATQEFHVDGSWADPRITKVDRRSPAGKVQPAPGAPPPSESSK
jgi:uncharacterized protein (TIGR02099 family)